MRPPHPEGTRDSGGERHCGLRLWLWIAAEVVGRLFHIDAALGGKADGDRELSDDPFVRQPFARVIDAFDVVTAMKVVVHL